MMLLSPTQRRRKRGIATAIAALVALTACAENGGVVSISADRTPAVDGESSAVTPSAAESTTTTAPTPTASTPPDGTASTDPPATTPTTVPEPTLPPIVEPALFGEVLIADVVNIDSNKPVRDYDSFLAASIADVERWWSEVYPVVYGGDFEPLEGGIYAGYPERSTDIPGCGTAVTNPDDLALFVAFYCQLGDFIVYDDANADVLAPLAAEFGPAVMGIVLAHEYGHAIQARVGLLDQALPTIVTEQQADCFAGAWTGQAYRGESDLLRLGDADVRAGLIAMLSVRDPVGTSQFVPGGHGSAFDRVGAFQEGFVVGPARCAELIDDALELVPNQFRNFDDQLRGGDASYDCSDDPSPNCTPAPVFLSLDLDNFWATLIDGFEPVEVLVSTDLSTVTCADARMLAAEVVLCPTERSVVYDEPAVLELYREFGDFTLGYYFGIAWSELAQIDVASALAGEPRALLNDCFTGAWVRDITPDDTGATPRQGDRDGDGVPDGIVSSPGDLDEAIRMAILEGDDGSNQDIVGTAFEKIAALRVGALDGIDACTERYG